MLRSRRVVADDRVAEGEVVRSDVAVERPPFSPAQLIALAIGIFFTVVGGVALARTGIDANNMNVHVTGPGWDHTTWTGIGELAFGLLMISAGVVPGAARGMMTFLGMLAVGAGILFLVDTANLQRTLAATDGAGWVYVIAGGASMLAAMVSPVFFTGARRGYAGSREILT